MSSDRWKAALAVLAMAAGIVAAKLLLDAATSPKALLRLPGLDRSIPAPSVPSEPPQQPVVEPPQKPQG